MPGSRQAIEIPPDGGRAAQRRPPWLVVRARGASQGFAETQSIVRTHGLNTVCHSAACPNIAECWGRGTATLMLLGNVCTRRCGFCAVLSGVPRAFDPRTGWLFVPSITTTESGSDPISVHTKSLMIIRI